MINLVPVSLHHRRSIRLPEYDYRQDGVYFVTLVIDSRASILGRIKDDSVHLSSFGQVVAETWHWLGKQYAFVVPGPFVVMPNHLHGILIFDDPVGSLVGALREAPLLKDRAPTQLPKRKPLGQVIGAFKTVSSKQINHLRSTPGMPLWQRNYYEHVVRNQVELERITCYIETNLLQWALDRENPENLFP